MFIANIRLLCSRYFLHLFFRVAILFETLMLWDIGSNYSKMNTTNFKNDEIALLISGSS